MTSWTDATPPGTGPLWRAVVRPDAVDAQLERVVLPVEAPLDRWVAQVWSLAWEAPVPPSTSTLISHPAVQLTLEAGPDGEVRHGHRLPAALAHGLPTRRWGVPLPAGGWVVGLHLVPGALRDLTGHAAHTLTDRVVPWVDVWPGWHHEQVFAASDARERARLLLASAAATIGDRQPTTEGERARAAERLARERIDLRTVEALAEQVGVQVRTLQRLCREHIGCSPGWLLRRARVHDAHELLTTTDLSVAQIADRTGFFDQAHLTRCYTAITGVPPVRLRRES